jgi:hypothetical protein
VVGDWYLPRRRKHSGDESTNQASGYNTSRTGVTMTEATLRFVWAIYLLMIQESEAVGKIILSQGLADSSLLTPPSYYIEIDVII